MKKYFLAGALGIASLAFSQNYPSGYGNQGYGNQGGYSQSGYGNDDYYDDDYYSYAYNNFPDDYYYEYPSDYYPSAYYQNYYNDYRKSITGIDWQRLAMEYRLSNYQMQQLMALNSRFSSFYEWNAYYGMNPDRWYYDRFYALQRILGPQIFVIIQNRYYGGYSPIRYFENYRRTYYQPRYVVVQKYRNIDVSRFRIDRDRYYQSRGNHYGGYNGYNARSQSGFPNRNYDLNRSSTIPQRSHGGFREGIEHNQNFGGDTGLRSRPQTEFPRTSAEPNTGRRSRDGAFGRTVENDRLNTAPSHQQATPGMRGGGGGFR